MNAKSSKICVVVSTYNSSSSLERALHGYARQTDPDFEVIIADDGSSDIHRRAYEKVLGQMPFHATVLWQPDEGFRKNVLMNRAILATSADYLVFTDGDCIPEPDFVAAHRRLRMPGTYLSGTMFKLSPEISAKISLDDIRAGIPFTVSGIRSLGAISRSVRLKIGAKNIGINRLLDRIIPVKATFNGANSSCWRKDALRVRGFDERMGYGSEDCEFGYRLVNAGIRPKRIRYSARCAHLDHSREYRIQAIVDSNKQIMEQTIRERRIETEFGLPPVPSASG